MNSIVLHRDDLLEIINIIDSLKPASESATIICDNSSGIGQIVEAVVYIDLNGLKGSFRKTIVDETSW